MLKDQGFPVSLDIITGGSALALNPQLVSYHEQHMENYAVSDRHGLVFSHCVLEHVEDLASVFQNSFRSLRPGGLMLHVVDLGGHDQFEDPVPPLDFQTYPDWLYSCMFPVHHRATRRFVADYRAAALAAGFRDVEIRPLRTADPAYVAAIHPRLRPAARKQPLAEIAIIEFVLSAVK